MIVEIFLDDGKVSAHPQTENTLALQCISIEYKPNWEADHILWSEVYRISIIFNNKVIYDDTDPCHTDPCNTDSRTQYRSLHMVEGQRLYSYITVLSTV